MRSTCGFIAGLVLGGLLGVAGGMMTAPESGEEIRRRVRSKAQHMAEEAMGEVEVIGEQLKRRVVEQTKEILDRSSDTINELEKKLQEAEQKLAEIEKKLEQASQEF